MTYAAFKDILMWFYTISIVYEHGTFFSHKIIPE